MITRRHIKDNATPLLLYTSLNICATVRSRGIYIIDHFFRIGLCVSYGRILEITKTIYENLRESYSLYHCFFPNILKKGLFTIMLKDNIDINAKATFVKSHYHGTSLSMVQFRDDVGIDFPEINFQTQIKEQSKKLLPLPTKHINV